MKATMRPIADLPGTSERVPRNTSEEANERIRLQMQMRLDSIGHDPERIEKRLQQIEREWDIERTLEANAATVILAGTLFGLLRGRRYLVLPAAAATFLLQHALQGWCPPLPFFRRRGVRTQREIEIERTILKARRGDLINLQDCSAAEAMEAMETVTKAAPYF